MNISAVASNLVSKASIHGQKHAPVILTIVGVGSLLAAGVVAAKATLKLEHELDISRAEIEAAKAVSESPKDARVAKAYIRSGARVAKLYAPSVLLAGTGVVCVVGAHGILHKRNAAAMAAYAGLKKTYDSYRERVREELGEDKERDIHQAVRTETETDESGKKHKVVKADLSGSDYTFSFGPENSAWRGTRDLNLYWLKGHEQMANDMLRARGHVFLNEILDQLCIPRTRAGQALGWVKKGEGDGYIDFGIRDMTDELGYITLDFNVDGIVWDKI